MNDNTRNHPVARFCRAIAGYIILILAAWQVGLPASAATLTQVTNFGDNPGNLGMYVYIPDGLTGSPPLLVAVHWCGGSAQDIYNSGQFNSLADQHRFMVVFPSSDASDGCFDVATQSALTRDGGSDPASIMSMVTYAIQNYGADPDRVYAAGISSGAMTTNVLLGLYPDVFKAGSAYAGVPFGCFATTNGSTWNSDCANGNIAKTAQEWGDLSRNQNPGYSGPWPRMQLWHGTNDEVLNYANFGEEIKQWTNLNGLSQTPDYTDNPQSGYTRTRYGSSGPHAAVEAISMAGTSHNLPVDAAEAIRFFGLDSSSSSSGGSCNGFPYCANGWNDDPDGDGWGWTGSESCIVAGSGPDSCSVSSSSSSSSSSTGGGSIADGRYRITSRFSGKAVVVENGSTANGANVILWSYGGGADQQWDITNLGEGYYSIRAAHSGKSLDVYNFCSSPGCEIRQWDYSGGNNQQWQIVGVDGGYYRIVSRHNGMPLDVWEWNADDGADVRQWSDTGDANQQWQLLSP